MASNVTVGWVDADQVLSGYADDLEDPRALEELERIRRAQQRANAVVEHVLAQAREEPGDPGGAEDLVEDDLEDGGL